MGWATMQYTFTDEGSGEDVPQAGAGFLPAMPRRLSCRLRIAIQYEPREAGFLTKEKLWNTSVLPEGEWFHNPYSASSRTEFKATYREFFSPGLYVSFTDSYFYYQRPSPS